MDPSADLMYLVLSAHRMMSGTVSLELKIQGRERNPKFILVNYDIEIQFGK